MPAPKPGAPAQAAGIGTERESSLHRSLKLRYAGPEGQTEKPLGGYVCDALRGCGEIIEVQTGSFAPLTHKIPGLLLYGPVRIIHPVIVRKTIDLREKDGAPVSLRKSPRKGSEWDLFKALLYAPLLPLTQGLTIELVMVEVLEKRVRDGRGSWRRKGASIADRELSACIRAMPLSGKGDYRAFVPFPAGEEFTARNLAEKARIRPALAGKALYVLTKIGVVERVRKAGNAWVYRMEA
ncbi:MAG: hypothetical protein LBE17_02530 [Treponema sp.]|jgi:hypothetical protein|nr:hypothetical protein [Treponema sp.]